MEYPQMIRVRQTFDDTTLDNVSEEINTQLANLKLETAVKPGQTAAVACSSRGIDNYGVIVKTVISYLKQLKLEPFIIPAMGSHGGGTAAGASDVPEVVAVVDGTGKFLDNATIFPTPPRSDVAQHVDWELADYTGQEGYLEIVDGMMSVQQSPGLGIEIDRAIGDIQLGEQLAHRPAKLAPLERKQHDRVVRVVCRLVEERQRVHWRRGLVFLFRIGGWRGRLVRP